MTKFTAKRNSNEGESHVRGQAKRSSVGLRPGGGTRRDLFGHLCVLLLGLTALLGSSSSAAAASVCPNAAIREQQGTVGLPDCRAYELVTPGVGKQGAELLQEYMPLAPDGDALLFQPLTPFGEATHGSAFPLRGVVYRASRDPLSGWRSTFVSRLPFPDPTRSGGNSNFLTGFKGGSPDLSHAFYDVSYCGFGTVCEPGFTSGVWSSDALGNTALIAGRQDYFGQYIFLQGTSADGSRQVVSTQQPLAPLTGPPLSGVKPGTLGLGGMLYELSGPGSEPRLVDTADGTSLLNPGGAVLATAIRPNSRFMTNRNPVSTDGSRIFFRSQPPGEAPGVAGLTPLQLYVRVDGERTVHLSAPEAGLPQPSPYDVLFAGASKDGTVAYFATTAQLTQDAVGAGPFLYRFTLPEGASQGRLELVSQTLTVFEDGVYNVPQAIVSDDGSLVYYRSPENGETIHVYDARSGDSRVVASGVGETLLAGVNGDSNSGESIASQADLDPSGLQLVFLSTTGFLDGQTGRQVYRYDYPSGDVQRVSNGPAAQQGPFDAGFEHDQDLEPGINVRMYPTVQADQNYVSDDGSTVFFETAAPLVPEDQNGAIDVYRWRDGNVALMSDGTKPDYSLLVGASRDGGSVFFLTRAELLARDGDQLLDVYAARTDGGFPVPAEPQPCSGDVCQAGRSRPPGPPVLGSSALQGGGNLHEPPRPSVWVLPITRRQSAQLARGRKVALRLRVDRPGRVVVSLRARVAGHRRQIARGSARVRKAGTVRVRIRLSRPARRSLTRTGRLSASLEARFAGVREKQRLTLRLRRPAGAASRSHRAAAHRADAASTREVR